MRTQKNNLFPTAPSDPEKQAEYNNALQIKLKEIIRDIVVDMTDLDTRLKALE